MNFTWLSRMFTIPHAERTKLAAIPGVHVLANAIQGATVALAQGVISQHVTDHRLAEFLNTQIEEQVHAHMPIPAGPDNIGDVVLSTVVPSIIPNLLHTETHQ